MIQLSDEQLNNLGKEALIVIVSSLQDQLLALQSQLDHANAQLSDNNRQIELLTEQIRIMNQRFFGRKSEVSVSEVDGQISLFDSFNEVEYLNQNSSKEPEITEVIIPSYHRKKSVGKRDADLSGLPARIIEHTLSAEELATSFPDGYKELPAEVYKRLHIIPETFIVDEHRRIINDRERHVFSSQTHEKMSVSCIEEIYSKYIDKAKREYPKMFKHNYTPHSMRHTTATHMLEAGVPLIVVKNFLGHVSLQTTQIYTEITQDTMNKQLKSWNDKWFLKDNSHFKNTNGKSNILQFLR